MCICINFIIIFRPRSGPRTHRIHNTRPPQTNAQTNTPTNAHHMLAPFGSQISDLDICSNALKTAGEGHDGRANRRRSRAGTEH